MRKNLIFQNEKGYRQANGQYCDKDKSNGKKVKKDR